MSDWKNREVDLDHLERHLENECKKRGITRRELMKGGMAMATALGIGALFAACGGDDSAAPAPAPAEGPAPAPAPAEAAPAFTGTLRVLGLGVDLREDIREIAERDLGFSLQFDVVSGVELVQKAITQSEGYDVWAGYQNAHDQVWGSGNFLPIDRTRITRWNEISNIHKLGKLDPQSTVCSYGDGDAFFRVLYVDPDESGTWPSSVEAAPELTGQFIQWVDESTGGTVGDEPPLIKGVPQNFNMDSIGYDADVIMLEPEAVSWAELLNEQWSGRVGLNNDPSVAMQDLGNAARAAGLMDFVTLGNMTRDEIDGLINIAIDFKQRGHFRAFWATFGESVGLMESGEVVVESMWSPAVAALLALGVNVKYASPPEGFRGWGSLQGIPSHLADKPAELQAAYDYLNWWHTGEPGAIMARQGYYNAVQEPSRQFLSTAEWDFWFGGQPAAEDLAGPAGNVGDIRTGDFRDGGGFEQRACRYASWNSFFTDNEHQVARFNEFLAA
jgi:putative spermidine/putrescine transport system substrate-binding protein